MRVRWVGVVGVLVAVGALSACGSGESSTHQATTTSRASTTTTVASGGGGLTAWVDATAAWKALATKPFNSSPQKAADDLAALWRGRDTSTVGTVQVVSVGKGEPAVVEIRETDGADASIASTDYEITLEPGDQGWAVSNARARSTCRTGVSTTDPTHCT